MVGKLNLRGVHAYEKVPGAAGMVRLTGTHHYVRVVNEGCPPLYIQDGVIYPEDGPAIDVEDAPDWFWQQVSLLTAEALAAVGFSIPDDRKVVVPPRDDTRGARPRARRQ
ncbi:MAG: hypothetical protein C5B59_17265 [Bacteroidetes bacterium]|nr:MAG: hypothetical protein C5B59_17265 [Bacteroidota bacterium]